MKYLKEFHQWNTLNESATTQLPSWFLNSFSNIQSQLLEMGCVNQDTPLNTLANLTWTLFKEMLQSKSPSTKLEEIDNLDKVKSVVAQSTDFRKFGVVLNQMGVNASVGSLLKFNFIPMLMLFLTYVKTRSVPSASTNGCFSDSSIDEKWSKIIGNLVDNFMKASSSSSDKETETSQGGGGSTGGYSDVFWI